MRAAIEQGPGYISVIAYWEVTVKWMKGGLGDIIDPGLWWGETMNALSLLPLLYRPEHVAALQLLPPIHQDPFDRAMIAQTIAEDLTFLTTDDIIPQYVSERFRVIR